MKIVVTGTQLWRDVRHVTYQRSRQ